MYKVIIEEVTVADQKTTTYEKLYESDHPRVVHDRESQYGYVNSVQTVTNRRQVYTQEVDELNLVAVIQAVNQAPTFLPIGQSIIYGRPGQNIEVQE